MRKLLSKAVAGILGEQYSREHRSRTGDGRDRKWEYRQFGVTANQFDFLFGLAVSKDHCECKEKLH